MFTGAALMCVLLSKSMLAATAARGFALLATLKLLAKRKCTVLNDVAGAAAVRINLCIRKAWRFGNRLVVVKAAQRLANPAVV